MVENQLENTFELSSGAKMHAVGMGTWEEGTKEDVVRAIKDSGYRHIDTASFYGNEEVIGAAVNECVNDGSVARADFFITTKAWYDQLDDPETALKDSLKRLNLEYVDLYLVHWPAAFFPSGQPLHKTWPKFEALVDAGLTKAVGVSNFNNQLLADLLTYARIKPVVNQVELNPLLVQQELVDYCISQNVRPVAYCPIARGGELTNHPVLTEIAEKYGVTPIQVVLNWNITRGVIVIPKSSNPDRQKANISVFHFKLTEEEVAKVSALDKNQRICFGNKKQFPDWKEYSCFA